MKKIHYLYLTIFMAIVTTLLPITGFLTLDPSKGNLALICCATGLGYLGTAFYYLTYKSK